MSDSVEQCSDPVMTVVKSGDEETLKQLLEQGCNYQVKSPDGFTPMHEAAEKGLSECVTLLLKAAMKDCSSAEEIRNQVCSPFQIRFSDNLGRPQRLQCTPLSLAAQNGHSKILKNLTSIYRGCKVGQTGYALHAACVSKNKKCIKILTKEFPQHLMEMDINCLLPIHIVASTGSVEAMETILKFGNYQKINRVSPIPKLIELQSGDVDICDIMGRTALHYAAKHGSCELVQFLLDRGADPSVKDDAPLGVDFTPLTMAASCGHLEVVKILADVTPFES